MSTDSLRAHTLCQYSVTFHFPQRLPTEDTCVTSPKDGSVSFPNLLQTRERQVVLWRLLHAIVGSRTPALSSLPNSSVRAKTIRCQAPPPPNPPSAFPPSITLRLSVPSFSPRFSCQSWVQQDVHARRRSKEDLGCGGNGPMPNPRSRWAIGGGGGGYPLWSW
jgi:hypothetical protein